MRNAGCGGRRRHTLEGRLQHAGPGAAANSPSCSCGERGWPRKLDSVLLEPLQQHVQLRLQQMSSSAAEQQVDIS